MIKATFAAQVACIALVAGCNQTAAVIPPTYSVSGTISGAVKSGVTLTLSGAGSATATSDASGGFSFAGVASGSYQLTPSIAGGYVFTPASLTVTVGNSDVAGQDFVGAGAFSLSGAVSGPVKAGVTLALTGTRSASTTSGASGAYSFPGLPNGNYTVTPSMTGSTFTPASAPATVNGASVTGVDFSDAVLGPGSFAIAGTITGLVKAGVTVTLSGAAGAVTTSDSSGRYGFTALAAGSYTVTPSLAGGYAFTPDSTTVAVVDADVNGEDFSDTGAWGVSGAISGLVKQGVTLTLGGAASAVATSGSSGAYAFTGLPDGSYTVTPSLAGGYLFTPGSASANVSGAPVTGKDFSDSGAWSISGTVRAGSSPLAGVTLTLDGGATTVTGADGTWQFTGLTDGSHTVVPSAAGDTFSPASQAVPLSGASATGVDFATCGEIQPTGSKAVAYQIDPAHSGAQPGDALSLPLCQRWSRDLGAPVSYALVADGRVFVTLGNSSASHTSLVALDEQTGATLWGPIDLGGTYFKANAAYDNGRVFAVNGDGLLRAVDAADGGSLWQGQMPGQYSFSSPPTASGGSVYLGGAGSGGTVYAVDQADGGVRWTAPVENGDDSSPAVGADGVYVSYACNQAYGFNPADGGSLWHHSGACEGGAGKTVALSGGHVYTRDFDGDLILDATTGALLGTYTSNYVPAFSASDALFTTTALNALQPGGTMHWSYDGGAPITAPIVVGQQVVIGTSDGYLRVLDANTGAVLSSVALAGIRGPDEQNVSAPLAGFSAADGRLFVPAGSSLIAY